MAIPAKFLNGGNAWVQKADAGPAMGHPDRILAYYIDDESSSPTFKPQIHFFELRVAGNGIGTWTASISADVHFKDENLTFVNPRGGGATGSSQQTISLVSGGVTEWATISKNAGEKKAKTYFYATSAKFNPSHVTSGGTKPYGGATYDPGKGAGTAPGDATSGTSQSTMYVIGGGALIGLLFLFAQK